MSFSFSSHLTVPADLRFVRMAQLWVREVSGLAGLSEEETLNMELAMEEGFSNAAEHAYPDGQRGPVHLEGGVRGSELVVSIRDEGVPYAPDAVPSPANADLFHGCGLKLISHAVHEVCFLNHGRAGKELRLTRHLAQPVETAQGQVGGEVPLAPDQSYQVRAMRPEEALQVARVFWFSYGYSYKNDSFYRPEGLLHQIGSGAVTSVVAVAENGEVVGHAGLLRPEPVPTAEAALLVVSPAHRGRGLMERLMDALLQEALNAGLYGAYSNPVTSHPVSQREILRMGAVPCGFELAACPPRNFKSLGGEGTSPQRESYLSCLRYFITPPPAEACVPARHQQVLRGIYQAFPRPLTFLPEAPATGAGTFDVAFDRAQGKGVIRVRTSNPDGWREIARSVKDMVDIAGAEVVSLDLPLSQPATPALWELAEQAGFFFVGLRPHEAADGDAVRLQRLFVPFDLGRLEIFPEAGQRLLAYVAQEMERVANLERV